MALSNREDRESSSVVARPHCVGISYNPPLPFQNSEWQASLMDHICVLSLFTQNILTPLLVYNNVCKEKRKVTLEVMYWEQTEAKLGGESGLGPGLGLLGLRHLWKNRI